MEIQPPDFRYTIKARDADYVLIFTPNGWDEAILNWKRNETYQGITRAFTIPMQFVKDGAKLLRLEYYQFGFEGKAELLVEQLTRKTWKYEKIFQGAFDFSRFRDSHNFVEINVKESGTPQLIEAYGGITYEIDIDVPEAVEVELTGIPLQQTFTDIITPTATYPGVNRFVAGLSNVLFDVLPESVEIQEVEVFQLTGPTPATPPYASPDKWFMHNISTDPITVDLHFELQGVFKNITPKIQIVTASGSVKSLLFEEYISNKTEIIKEVSFTLNAGEKVSLQYFYVTTASTAGYLNYFSVNSGLIKCSFGSAQPNTFCKALRPKYVLGKLLEKMNGAPVEFQSFLLKEWEQLVITSGDAIRGIAGAKIKTSFRDFYQSYNGVLNIGFGMENGIPVFERKDYFYKPNLQSTHLEEIKYEDFSLDVAENYIFNSVKVGYPNQSYDKLNGRDEFNATQVYSLPVTKIEKEYNIVSVYRADCFGIEFTRINLEGKDSTDSEADNNIFFIYLKKDPETGHTYFRPERKEDGYSSVSGVLSPGHVYNMRISPKQNLMRHGYFLRGGLADLSGSQVIFRSADKNSELSTVFAGKRVTENSNVDVPKLGDKMFLPHIVNITTALPKNTMSLIDRFPTGFIKFTYKQTDFSGFILEASVDVSRNREREFKLLLTPNNNLLKLIR